MEREEGCLFCQIVKGKIDAEIVYEDEFTIAFRDINPKAKVHVLVVPKSHTRDMNSFSKLDDLSISRIIQSIPEVADKLGIGEGYRVQSNCGRGGGQEVFHLHFHLMSGS